MLDVEGVSVAFDGAKALEGVSLQLAPGSVTAVLGPSGSGKSTLLRVIAGLQRPDSGRIRWDGRDVTDEAPHLRGFGLMFQDYALFPHRTVARNVGFGLKMRGDTSAQIAARVEETLGWVGLAGFGDRAIATLSGGEQQRVALARTLAPEPKLLMLDEPVGSLDRELRTRLVGELRAMLADESITALYVTHDQEEALALADHLVIMRDGRVIQQGAPAAVWRRPADQWVARFLGFENVFDQFPGLGQSPVVIHADAIELGSGDREATITGHRFHGSVIAVTLLLDSGFELEAHVRGSTPEVGEKTSFSIDPAGVVEVSSSR